MKYRAFILVAASMLIFSTAAAQDDCGDGLPCGKIPWDLPALPSLQSPTPIPTVALTQVPPTQTPGGPTATPTSAPTSTPTSGGFDSGLNDQVATLGAVIQTTPLVINDANGTPVNTTDSFDEMGANAGTFFGYARGLSEASFGEMSPLFNFGFLALIIVISIKLLTFLLPIGSAIFGILRNIISLVRDFIPI